MGIGVIYLGYSRESFVRKEKVLQPDGKKKDFRHFGGPEQANWKAKMTADAGSRHAIEARDLARSARVRAGSVLWFDNEDPTGVIFTTQELEYYDAFFTEIGSPRGDRAAFRPGLYAHQAIAAQLLVAHPDLHLWEVDYGPNVKRSVLPPQRPVTLADPRIGPDPANREVVLASFVVVPPAPARPWVAWPAWRQFEGNNQGRSRLQLRDTYTSHKLGLQLRASA